MVVQSDGSFFYGFYHNISSFGVRPVIVISKDYFPKEVINFTIGGVSYQADDGMTWSEWIDSEYNIGGFEKDFVNNLVVNKDGYNINSVVLKDVIMMGYNYTISSEMPPT